MTVDDGVQDFRRLSAFAAQLDVSERTRDVIDQAGACLLYGLAVGIATVRARSVRIICRAISTDAGAGTGDATQLLDGCRTTAGNAALANGVLLSGRVQGDSHPAGHIGGVVIPAALAVAEQCRLSGAEFLSAMTAGYEVALRIGRHHAEALTRRGFRTTPCYGVFGAAAAGARGLNLNADQMLTSLALAANFAGGLREYVLAGTEESPFQAGIAARNGLTAAFIVKSGLEAAAPSALHGKSGFFSAFGDGDVYRAPSLTDDLDSHFEFTTVTYKPYPACQFLRGLIRCLATLRTDAAEEEVERIDINLSPFEAEFVGVRYAGPFSSPAQTVMSAPFCAALAWTTGAVGYDGLRQFDQPAVLAVVPRVHIVADPSCSRYQTKLRVRLRNGRELMADDVSGDADFRLNRSTAEKAARALLAEVDTSVDALIEVTDAADRLSDVRPIVTVVRRTIEDIIPQG